MPEGDTPEWIDDLESDIKSDDEDDD